MKSQNLNRNWCWLFVLAACLHGWAAAPTFQSFESTQFDTNTLTIKYRSDWTNELGVIRPATVNTEVTLTNLNLYETFVTPAKVYALSLGTNELNVATNTSWLLSSPTNDASQVILSLSAGKFQGQWLLITSQNDTGGFTLPDGSEQYDVPGALVDTQGDWVGTTNRGSILQYVAPDWIEMFRFNPELPAPAGFTIGAGLTNIGGVLSATGGGGDAIFVNTDGIVEPAGGQTATNRFSFTSGAVDDATNSVADFDTVSAWTDGAHIGRFRKQSTNQFVISPWGGLAIGPRAEHDDFYGPLDSSDAIRALYDVSNGDSTSMNNQWAIYTNSDFVENSDVFLDLFQDGIDGRAVLTLSSFTTINGGVWELRAGSGSQLSHFIFTDDADRVSFKPQIASTGSAVAHFLGTSNVMTNGDSLFQIKNADVNRVKVQHDGTLSIQNTTNRLGDNGSAITYNGIVIGGSASVITYTNQFVYNSKVTYNADVYHTNATIYINGVDVRGDARLLACSDLTTAITVSTNKAYFYAPYALTVTRVKATLNIAQASGSTFTVDINEAGTSILSTKLTVDNAENTSDDATAAPVISDAAIANNARVSIDVDQIGNGTAAGLIVEVYFTPQ